MKLLHISDTHGFHDRFPRERFEGIDVMIHSGDFSNNKNPLINFVEVTEFLNWYEQVPVPHKILVAGNHDVCMERKGMFIHLEDITDRGIIYLENSEVVIDGVKFWGSPYTPTFGRWAFMKARDKINRIWENIPDDTQVLITHGPPKGVRDLSYDRDGNLHMAGCSALMKRCWALRNTLKLHCFGHLHNMKGIDTNQGVAHFSHSPTIFSNGACVFDGRFDYGLTSFGNIITI